MFSEVEKNSLKCQFDKSQKNISHMCLYLSIFLKDGKSQSFKTKVKLLVHKDCNLKVFLQLLILFSLIRKQFKACAAYISPYSILKHLKV